MDEQSVHQELVRLSTNIDWLREDGRRRDDKLDRLMDKLEPLPGLVDDVAEIKPKVESLQAESHRRAGVIALVCTMVGMFGAQAADWVLSALGKK